MKCPCHGCERRTITCHGVCRQYQEWKVYNEDRNKWLREYRYEPSEGMRKGERHSLRALARGWRKRGVKDYE